MKEKVGFFFAFIFVNDHVIRVLLAMLSIVLWLHNQT